MTQKPWQDFSFKLNEKGQFSYVLFFVVFIIMFMPIVLFGFPTMQTIAIAFFGATEEFNAASNNYLQDINDPNLREDINAMIAEQTASQQTNIDVLGTAIIFGPIAIAILVYLGLYLIGRRNIEVGSMG